MKRSAFLAWFVSQHGPRERYHQTDAELEAARLAGIAAARELDRRREWDRREESALYAWNARRC